MIRGSDGLDYEDLGARLLGEPADTGWNRVLGPSSRQSEEYKAGYRAAYIHYEAEGYGSSDCHRRAFAQASFSEEQRRRARAKSESFGTITIDPTYTLADSSPTQPPGGGPGGAGGPGPVQAPLAAIRAAFEPPLRRRLGP